MMSKSLEEIQADKELEVIMNSIQYPEKTEKVIKLCKELKEIEYKITWDGLIRDPSSEDPPEKCYRFRAKDIIWYSRKEEKLKEINDLKMYLPVKISYEDNPSITSYTLLKPNHEKLVETMKQHYELWEAYENRRNQSESISKYSFYRIYKNVIKFIKGLTNATR